jgi:hypothetical protein
MQQILPPIDEQRAHIKNFREMFGLGNGSSHDILPHHHTAVESNDQRTVSEALHSIEVDAAIRAYEEVSERGDERAIGEAFTVVVDAVFKFIVANPTMQVPCSLMRVFLHNWRSGESALE